MFRKAQWDHNVRSHGRFPLGAVMCQALYWHVWFQRYENTHTHSHSGKCLWLVSQPHPKAIPLPLRDHLGANKFGPGPIRAVPGNMQTLVDNRPSLWGLTYPQNHEGETRWQVERIPRTGNETGSPGSGKRSDTGWTGCTGGEESFRGSVRNPKAPENSA